MVPFRVNQGYQPRPHRKSHSPCILPPSWFLSTFKLFNIQTRLSSNRSSTLYPRAVSAPRLLRPIKCVRNLLRINTCESVSKQKTLTTFRMNTYEKPRGGGWLWLTKNRHSREIHPESPLPRSFDTLGPRRYYQFISKGTWARQAVPAANSHETRLF